MKIYIQATYYDLWKVIVNGPNRPTKTINGEVVDNEEKECDKNDLKGVQTNAKAMNLVYCVLDPNEFNRINLVTHEGTNKKYWIS